jgi:glutamate dehydrogenase (NAD(P)+)
VGNAELLELPCDVLIPAAIENQIGEHNADRLRCRLVVEGANGPTSMEADAILHDRGVRVVPDILANAGGVTCSYFEWVQSSQQIFWTETEVNGKLINLMQQAYRRVHDLAVAKNIDMRRAALQLGIQRIAQAKRTRGVFP